MIQARFCTVLTSSWHLNQVAAPKLASTSTDSEGQTHDKNTRSVWKSTLLTWLSELLECYRFECNKGGAKAIKATCIVCSNHWGKISSEYKPLTNLMTEKQFKQLWSFLVFIHIVQY